MCEKCRRSHFGLGDGKGFIGQKWGKNRLIHLQRFDIFSYIKVKREFPGGPLVRAPHLHCLG